MGKTQIIPNFGIIKKDKKELIKLCKTYEDIFYVQERKNPLLEGQWNLDDLSNMAEMGRRIVSIIRESLH